MSESPTKTARAMVDASGRVVLPAAFRKVLGFRERQEVFLTLDAHSVRLEIPEAALARKIKRVQAIARKHGGGTGGEVDAFLAERRAEAARE